MKTITLNELKSGNFYITNHETDKTKHVFFDEEHFKEWYAKNIGGTGGYKRSYGSRIIKATYRMSQTYFSCADEVIKWCEKHL